MRGGSELITGRAEAEIEQRKVSVYGFEGRQRGQDGEAFTLTCFSDLCEIEPPSGPGPTAACPHGSTGVEVAKRPSPEAHSECSMLSASLP